MERVGVEAVAEGSVHQTVLLQHALPLESGADNNGIPVPSVTVNLRFALGKTGFDKRFDFFSLLTS